MNEGPNQPPQQPNYGQPQHTPYNPQQYEQPTVQYNSQPQYSPPQPQYGVPPPYGQPQYGQPQYGQPQYGQPQYGQPQYGVPPVPGYAMPQPQKKGSLRWLWITLGIVGGIIVLACAGCAILGAVGVNLFGQVVAPATTVTEYYQSVSAQDYTKAYSYWDTGSVSVGGQTLTQDAYIKAAQALDSTEGKVTSARSSNFNVNNDTATFTMTVARSGRQSYDVHLQLKKVGNGWKIVSADGI